MIETQLLKQTIYHKGKQKEIIDYNKLLKYNYDKFDQFIHYNKKKTRFIFRTQVIISKEKLYMQTYSREKSNISMKHF